jgi:hypothetical protein
MTVDAVVAQKNHELGANPMKTIDQNRPASLKDSADGREIVELLVFGAFVTIAAIALFMSTVG